MAPSNNINNKRTCWANKSLNFCLRHRCVTGCCSPRGCAFLGFKLSDACPRYEHSEDLGWHRLFLLLNKLLHMKKYCRSACGWLKGPVLSSPPPPSKAAFPFNAYTTATGSPINMFTPDSVIKSEEGRKSNRELLYDYTIIIFLRTWYCSCKKYIFHLVIYLYLLFKEGLSQCRSVYCISIIF